MIPRLLAASLIIAACLRPYEALGEQDGEEVECSNFDPCDPGVPCVDGVCREPEEVECSNFDPCDPGVPCVDGICQVREDQGGTAQRGRGSSDSSLGGVQGFLGLAAGAGFSGFWSSANGFAIEPAMIVSARAGVLVGSVEIALEIAPYSLFLSFDGDMGMGLSASVGWLEPIASRIYWPIRVGLGLSLIENPLVMGELFPTLQIKADIIGFVIHHGNWLFELSLPSVRYHPLWDPQRHWCRDDETCGILGRPDNGVFVFLFTFSASYLF